MRLTFFASLFLLPFFDALTLTFWMKMLPIKPILGIKGVYFEDLNLSGMKAMWGRKVSDLGFSSFVKILEWEAFKRGKSVVKIDRFTPTTKTCSGCGQRHHLTLRDRVLSCDCGLVIDRDHNAAINIKTAGISAVYRSASQTKVRLRQRVDERSRQLMLVKKIIRKLIWETVIRLKS